MSEDRPWLGDEPRAPDLTLPPGPVGLAAFSAIAAPVSVYGLTRPDGVDGLLIAFGLAIAALLGIAVAAILRAERARAGRDDVER